MSDQTNPLATVGSPQQPAAQAPELSPVEKAQQAYIEERRKLSQIHQDLVRSLESRVTGTGDVWDALIAGGRPTRSGSAFEGIGAMGAELGRQEQESKKAGFDIAKMRAELAAQQLGFAKEDIELAKENEAIKGLKRIISGTADQTAGGGSSSIPADIANSINVRLAAGDRKGAQEVYDKYVLKAAEKPEKIKEFEYHLNQLESPAAKAFAQLLFRNNYFLGSPSERAKTILEIRTAVRDRNLPKYEADILINGLNGIGFQTPPQTAVSQPSAVVAPATIDKGEIEKPFTPPADYAPVGTPSPRTSEGDIVRPAPPSQPVQFSGALLSERQQSEVATAGARVKEEEQSKLDVKRREALQVNSEKADRIINDANTVFELSDKNPNAFGILSQPGVSSGLITAIENGIRVGNFSVGLNDIQSAMLKAKGTQQDIDAAAALMQVAVQTSLDLSAAVKGSVSNYEQQLFQQASFSKNDSPSVLKYKAELARARGSFDKFVWSKFKEFEAKNPSIKVEDFKQTPQYKSYVKQYEDALKNIRSAYFR